MRQNEKSRVIDGEHIPRTIVREMNHRDDGWLEMFYWRRIAQPKGQAYLRRKHERNGDPYLDPSSSAPGAFRVAFLVGRREGHGGVERVDEES